MTYNLLSLLILVCYANADFIPWDGRNLATGQKIRIEVVNDELGTPLTTTQWVYPSSYAKQPYVLSGTADQTKQITFTIQSASYKRWNTPVVEYPNFQYSGWELTLRNDGLGGNVYRWRNRYAVDPNKNPAATPIILANQTYDASTLSSSPYVWLIRPDNSFAEGIAYAGGILNAKIPIGDVSWVRNTNLRKEGCKYKLWIDAPAAGPAPSTTTGSEIRIWSCDQTTSTYYYDPAIIRFLAQTADSITIRSTNNPAEYIKTTSPNSYALDSLRIGRTLSFTSKNPAGNVITTDWTGPMINSMWNTGLPSDPLSFFTIPYWACGNVKGLHLGSFPNNICQWDYSGATTPGGISIYITRNLDANIPIWRCITQSSVVSQIPLLSTASVQAIGAQTKAITIYSTLVPTESVTTTSSNAYAIGSLKAGKSLSFQTNGGYAIQSDWTGSKVSNMWNSCGSAGNFIDKPYWACNNGDGLHLTTDCCNWISYDCGNSPPGGISIAIQPLVKPPVRYLRIWSCTAAGQYALDFALSQIQTFASQATAVTIMSRTNPDEYVTSTSSSFALQSLQNGKSLSHSISNGYTSTSQWVGTKTDQIWNSCGNSQSFDVTVFWACNNGGGLHITSTLCGWTSSGTPPPGGIGVYLHMPN
jgi:hypothetical protein